MKSFSDACHELIEHCLLFYMAMTNQSTYMNTGNGMCYHSKDDCLQGQ